MATIGEDRLSAEMTDGVRESADQPNGPSTLNGVRKNAAPARTFGMRLGGSVIAVPPATAD